MPQAQKWEWSTLLTWWGEALTSRLAGTLAPPRSLVSICPIDAIGTQ